jgi:hypothetical protein
LSGAGRSVTLDDGRALWLFDAAHSSQTDDLGKPNPGAIVPAGASGADCFASVSLVGGAHPQSLIDPWPGIDGSIVRAMGGITALHTTWLYVSIARPASDAPFGEEIAGYGIARLDPATGRFSPLPSLLWTKDRPTYGSSVVLSGGLVYVYGCKVDGLSATCFVARASPGALSDPSAYSYYTGSDQWSPSVEDAWPIADAGDPIGVAPDGAGGWLMTYVTPLGSSLMVRRGLAPQGPWSSAFVLADCLLPDADAFCSGGFPHPELGGEPGSIAVSYAVSSFTADFGSRALASPSRYGPTLAVLALSGSR